MKVFHKIYALRTRDYFDISTIKTELFDGL